MKRNRDVTVIIVTLLIALFLIAQVDLDDILGNLGRVGMVDLSLGFMIFISYNALLTLRAGRLIHSAKLSPVRLFGVIAFQVMLIVLLPARSGELSYPYLLKKRGGVDVSEGVATLVAARLMDVISLVSYFIVASWFVFSAKGGGVSLVVTAAMLCLLFLLLFNMKKCTEFFLQILERVISPAGERFQFIVDHGRALSESLSAMEKSGRYVSALFLSFAVWGLRFCMVAFLLSAMGVTMAFWKVVFASTVMYFAASQPFQGVANLGTWEGGWAGGFMLVGVGKDVAISTAFSFHAIVILFAVLLGSAGYLLSAGKWGGGKGARPGVKAMKNRT